MHGVQQDHAAAFNYFDAAHHGGRVDATVSSAKVRPSPSFSFLRLAGTLLPWPFSECASLSLLFLPVLLPPQMLLQGEGVPVNVSAALERYLIASEHGSVEVREGEGGGCERGNAAVPAPSMPANGAAIGKCALS